MKKPYLLATLLLASSCISNDNKKLEQQVQQQISELEKKLENTLQDTEQGYDLSNKYLTHEAILSMLDCSYRLDNESLIETLNYDGTTSTDISKGHGSATIIYQDDKRYLYALSCQHVTDFSGRRSFSNVIATAKSLTMDIDGITLGFDTLI